MDEDTPSASGATSATSSSSSSSPGILGILVFVHGFKGDDTTFGDYPQRLRHSLSSTFGPSSEIHAIVYPAFDTRGELSQCVENFGAWLTERVAEIEMDHATRSPSGKKELARVVLVGHSMGGIVVADCARSVVKGYKIAGEQRVWPKIVGIMAYDTPYLGVHPGTFKNTATEAWGYVQQAQAVAASVGAGWALFNDGSAKGQKAPQGIKSTSNGASSGDKGKGKQKASNQDEKTFTESLAQAGAAAQKSAEKAGNGWAKYAYAAAGVSALAAAAGTAWYSRQQIASTATTGQLWVTSHLEFVGSLWKTEALRERLEEVMDLEDYNVQFHCFYTLLDVDSRTFIVLPSSSSFPAGYVAAERNFTSNKNTKAKNEIEAHTTMFDPANDGVYILGQQSAAMIANWLRTEGRKERM